MKLITTKVTQRTLALARRMARLTGRRQYDVIEGAMIEKHMQFQPINRLTRYAKATTK